MQQETFELVNWVSVGGKPVKEIVIEEMTGEEEDILFDATKKDDASGKMAKGGPQRITEILSRCTVRMGDKVRPDGKDRFSLPGFFSKEWEDAATNDRVYGIVRIRMLSIGPFVKHDTIKCSACDKEILGVVSDLRSHPVVSIPVPGDENEFYTFTLPKTGTKVLWSPVRGPQGEDDASRVARSSKHELISALMALKVKKIDGKDVSLEEAKRLLKRLPTFDRQALREEIDKKEGGFDATFKLTCDNPECQSTVESRLEVMAKSFFIPSETPSQPSSTSSQ